MEENNNSSSSSESSNEEDIVRENDIKEIKGEDILGEAEQESQSLSETEVTGLEGEIAELKDKLLRALAENENLIRRGRRDREDALKFAATNFARDMLSVADNLARALSSSPEVDESCPKEVTALLEGIRLTEKELMSTLERHGVSRIAAKGEKFNHNQHEALFEVPTGGAEPGTIVEVVEEGYMLHERLLRAAKVGVSKASDPSQTE